MTFHRDNPRARPSSRPARPAGGGGFTLVELLVVIAIIALLAGIIAPTLGTAITLARRRASLAIVNQLDMACYDFKQDHDFFPPSDSSDYGAYQGGQLLALYLTGYGPDQGNDGTPGTGGSPWAQLATDDGAEGFGFRLRAKQRIYGPYQGAHMLEMSADSDGRAYFIDAFNAPICYYRFDESSETYSNDNSGGPCNGPGGSFWSGGDFLYAMNASNQYYRRDFVLCSPGGDEQWTRPATGDSDDVTNFEK